MAGYENWSNEIYSYLNVNGSKVLDIVEKQKISNIACCGAYGFSSYKNLLLNYIEQNVWKLNIVKYMEDRELWLAGEKNIVEKELDSF
mgnify:CR=1 FL=1